jgi:hypothetical protein
VSRKRTTRPKVVPLCPTCGWIGKVSPHRSGWPPACEAQCGSGWSTDWIKVDALPAHLARASAEYVRLAKVIAFAEAAIKRTREGT